MGPTFEYRLPTEAEWEYAARAGTTTQFAFGESLNTSQASFTPDRSCRSCGLKEVGSYQPNAFGLYDMHGNVVEWVQDVYSRSYENLPTDGSANLTIGDMLKVRVLRGGAWAFGESDLRSAKRRFQGQDQSFHWDGFRVVARLK